VLIVASVLAALAAQSAVADEGPFEVRIRAIYLDPANKSDAIPALAVPEDAIHINSKTLPEIDFEYFFTPVWSSELILTYPQSQTVTVEKSALGGPVDIGTFKHLPPILTGKYNFNPTGDFRPYLGVGVNFTLLSDVRLAVPGVGALELSRTSVGPAAQGGFDYRLAEHWFANVDVKWAMLRADVKLDSAKVSRVDVDPLLFGVGVGYRF
jgi:outer membrane protein